MTDEEKKAIEYWKRDISFYHYNTQLASEHYAQIILNLIEKQDKIIKGQSYTNKKMRKKLNGYKRLFKLKVRQLEKQEKIINEMANEIASFRKELDLVNDTKEVVIDEYRKYIELLDVTFEKKVDEGE